jgi:hypothetical protein
MSHKTTLKTNIDNKEALIGALAEMGFTVKEEKTSLSAWGWTMVSDFAISRDGKSMNIGAEKQKDGTYRVEADLYKTGFNITDFQDQLNVLHGKHKVNNWMLENRYQTTFETDEAGDLVVVGRRWN